MIATVTAHLVIDRVTARRTATSETLVVEGLDAHGNEIVFIARRGFEPNESGCGDPSCPRCGDEDV